MSFFLFVYTFDFLFLLYLLSMHLYFLLLFNCLIFHVFIIFYTFWSNFMIILLYFIKSVISLVLRILNKLDFWPCPPSYGISSTFTFLFFATNVLEFGPEVLHPFLEFNYIFTYCLFANRVAFPNLFSSLLLNILIYLKRTLRWLFKFWLYVLFLIFVMLVRRVYLLIRVLCFLFLN